MCKETLRNTVTAQSRQQYTNNSFNMWKRKLKNIIYPDGFLRAWILDCQYIWPAAPRSLEMEWANSYELEILAWNPACFSYQSLNEWVILFSPLVKKKKKGNEMKWNGMKCWECEGGRLTELHQVVSSIPNMPTHIKSLVNVVTVYSRCKTPWAGKSAKSTVTASHKYTSVAFINFRHLRTETPANKCSSNPLVSQQEWQKWIMCSEYPFYQVVLTLKICGWRRF